MKRIKSHLIGVDAAEVILFSDYEDGGDMWTGRGPRERRRHITFSEPFATPPHVQLSISMWDVDTNSPLRSDLRSEAVTGDGFDMVFRTWGDTRIARVRVHWTATGALPDEDVWDVG